VANVAQNVLQENNQAELDAALAQLKYLQDFDPELVYREDMYPYIECATFADDIKYHGGGWQGDFHFVDYPFIDQAGKDSSDYPDSEKKSSRNITEAIKSIVGWIGQKDGDAYLNSYIYDYIQNRLYPGNPDVAKSYALRLLIHYLGDIHQPMHCESRYNDDYPKGDVGGNDFPIPYHYEADELHAVWDKGIYTLRNNIARPFTDSTYQKFQDKTVTPYLNTYKYSLSDTLVKIPEGDIAGTCDAWSLEAYDIAIGNTFGESIYEDVTENEPVPQSYIDKFVPILEDHITLGGYRLAALTVYMYGDSNVAKDIFPTVFLN